MYSKLVIFLLVLVNCWSCGSSLNCRYDLSFNICIQHLSKNETLSCDDLRSELELRFGENSIQARTHGLEWRGESVDNLEFGAEKNGVNLQYLVPAQISG